MENGRYFFFSFFLLVHDDFSQESEPRSRLLHFTFSRALKIMLTKCEIIHDAVKSRLTAFWIILSVSLSGVGSQEGKEKLQSLLQSLKSVVQVLVKFVFALQA